MAEERIALHTTVGESVEEDQEKARERVLHVTGGAVAPEGSVDEETADVEPERVIAWLFQPDAEPRRIDVGEIADLVKVEDYLVWIDLAGYEPDELRRIAQQVGLGDPTIRAALAPWQRPRVDILGDHFFVSVTVPELDIAEQHVVARQLDLVVGENYLVSAHKQPLPFTTRLLNRAGHDPDLIRLDSGFMLYIVLDELLAYGEDLDEHVRGDIERLQERALRDSDERFLEEMLSFKRYAFALDQLVEQHEPVFHAFLRPDFPFLSGAELSNHFANLEDRLRRLIDRLRLNRHEVNNTFDIYLSHQSHRTNGVMKTLTMVATLLFTVSVIEGAFSISFQGIPTHTVPSFVVMLALIALACATLYYLFKRRGWV